MDAACNHLHADEEQIDRIGWRAARGPSRVDNEKAPIGELISVSLYRGNAGSSKVGSALLCLLLVLCTLCFAGARCLPDVDSRWPGRNQASNACVDNLTTRVHVIVVIRVVGREVWSGMQGTIELSEEGREKYFPSSENKPCSLRPASQAREG